MLGSLKSKLFLSTAAGLIFLSGCAAPPPPPPPPPAQHHPAYLHALSDLRASRWMIEHRTGDWAQTVDEVEAVHHIDAAINDLKKAAYDDGKNLNDHPPVDERPDHRGRLHAAIDYLKKARSDIAREEDNQYADHLRDRALGHIDGALKAARRVFND